MDPDVPGTWKIAFGDTKSRAIVESAVLMNSTKRLMNC